MGEYAEAIDIARRRLRADPHDIEAGILLGNAFHAGRSFFLADAAYVATLAECTDPAEPRRREIRRLMARNFTLSRRFDQAIPMLDALLAEKPNDIAARLLLVDTLTKARQFDAALALRMLRPTTRTPATHWRCTCKQPTHCWKRGVWPKRLTSSNGWPPIRMAARRTWPTAYFARRACWVNRRWRNWP